VYVGYGAVGVAHQPEGRDGAWLASHCWVCHRSREEIRGAEALGAANLLLHLYLADDVRGDVLGHAVEHSIEDPFTGEITVRIRLA
jgi:hypothetical protein